MKNFACAALCIGLFQPFAVANESGCVSFVEDGKDYFPHKAAVEDSQHWTVQYEKTYKVVNNMAGSEVYLLYQCGTPIPSDADQYDGVFPVPLEGAGLLSTTMIPFLEILGAREDISAFLGSASWVASPCMGELFDQGIVEAVPNPYNASTIDNISLDLPSFVGNFGGTVLNDEIRVSLSEEDTNLAAFEWIKFYSLFFNMEEQANEIFSATKNRYDCAVENAALLACDNEKKPVVLWASYSYFCGGWDVASCPNYYCEFAENCQAEILSSEDQGSFYSELCFRNYMTTEEFIEFGKDADIWIYTSPDFDTVFADFGANLTDFVSVQDSLVYDTEGSGAGAWFEQRLVEPDVILQDFCNVVGNENLNVPVPHQRAWLRNVFTEPVGSLGQCENTADPLIPKATQCFALPADHCQSSGFEDTEDPPSEGDDKIDGSARKSAKLLLTLVMAMGFVAL